MIMNASGGRVFKSNVDATVVRNGLVDQVIDFIRSDISAGNFAVGKRLPSEAKLSEHFKVGRSTIREALKALSLIGLVETVNGRGTFVTAQANYPSSAEKPFSAEHVPKLVEVVEFRCMIEVEAAYWAAQRRSSKQLAGIRGIWKRYSEAIEDGRVLECVRLDADFHTAIVRAARNQFIIGAYEWMRGDIEWVGKIIFSGGPLDRKKDVHEQLIRGLEEGNPVLAVKSVRQNFEDLNTYIRTMIARQPAVLDQESHEMRSNGRSGGAPTRKSRRGDTRV